MIKLAAKGVIAFFLAITAVTELNAQEVEQWGSVALHVGLFSPMTTFKNDMSGGQVNESSFNSAAAIGASATAWFVMDRKIGVRAEIVRSHTDGESSISEFAPMAVNDPTQWVYSAEVIGRLPMDSGSMSWYPYLSAGVGMKQYNWAEAIHDEDRFLAFTGSAGVEAHPGVLGRFGVLAELRAYQSEFKKFGINDGTWETGTPAREGTNIGFFGGVTHGVSNIDLLFSTGLSYSF